MTEAEGCIAALDAALAEYGEDIRLQRMIAGPDGVQIPFEVVCRASVRSSAPQELAVMTGEAPATKITISPTQIAQRQWPGPPRKDDRLFIQSSAAPGAWLATNVEIVSPISIAGQVVRIDMQCRE